MVELLSPAGSYTKLEYAYAFGADAAYVGIPLFSLRARENEFNLDELKRSIELKNKLGKKLYVTCNIFARNRKINAFNKQIDEIIALKPDALIMGDPGLMMMVRERHADIPIHLSVQANCMNWQAVKFWNQSLNIERVILSRELTIDEIREIKQRVPDVELEAFVHGSICIAYSGRCLLSSYFSHRDANQGVCDNSCRDKFKMYETPSGKKDYYLEDLRNQGEFYQIDEDENGTLIMNAKDLSLIEHLKEIIDAGVCSLKIEGRTKSEQYVSLVTRAYRQALDDYYKRKDFNPELLAELEKVANRGYHKGFMIPNPGKDQQNYESSFQRKFTQQFAGLVQNDLPAQGNYIPVEIRNRISVGQQCEILEPSGRNFSFEVKSIKNKEAQEVQSAHGGTGVFYVEMPKNPEKYSVMSVLI